jgi:hypothetical protein
LGKRCSSNAIGTMCRCTARCERACAPAHAGQQGHAHVLPILRAPRVQRDAPLIRR